MSKDKIVNLSLVKDSKKVDVKETMVKALDDIEEEIDCGIVLIKSKEGNTFSGFFNTSFQDEALLKEILSQDVLMRKLSTEMEV